MLWLRQNFQSNGGCRMKLAEALAGRKTLQQKVKEVSERANDAVRVQGGDAPPEPVDALLRDLASALEALEVLTVRINRNDVAARLSTGETIMEAIARRDRLRAMHAVLRAAADAGHTPRERWGRQEIRYVATVDVAQLRRRVDEGAKRYRDLDTALQAVNWQVELAE